MSKSAGYLYAKGDGKKGKGATKKSRLKPPAEEDQEGRARRGRPAGKRSDPAFIGFTTYIRKQTHRSVKRALLDEPEDIELSELVEELLNDWLKSRPKH